MKLRLLVLTLVLAGCASWGQIDPYDDSKPGSFKHLAELKSKRDKIKTYIDGEDNGTDVAALPSYGRDGGEDFDPFSAGDPALPEEERLATLRLAFFAPGHDASIWLTG